MPAETDEEAVQSDRQSCPSSLPPFASISYVPVLLANLGAILSMHVSILTTYVKYGDMFLLNVYKIASPPRVCD